MAKLGMDPAEIDALAGRLDTQVQAIRSVVDTVESLVRRAEVDWYGGSAAQFAATWHGRYRPMLLRAGDSISGLATSARTNASQQRLTSAQNTSNGGSGRGTLIVQGAPSTAATLPSTLKGYIEWANSKGKSPWFAGVSGDASHQFGGETWWVHPQGSGSLGSIPISGEAGISGIAQVNSSAHGTLSLRNGAEASVAVGAAIGVTALASGSAGNRFAGADASARGALGANADASAKAHVGLSGASASAHGSAFAGAKAEAQVSAHLSGLSGSAGVQGYAGAGVEGDADVSVSASDVSIHLRGGAALGLGLGVDVKVKIDPAEAIHNISRMKLW